MSFADCFLTFTIDNSEEIVTQSLSNTLPKTPNEAVSEMTWGVNLAELLMADSKQPDGSTKGYYDKKAQTWGRPESKPKEKTKK